MNYFSADQAIMATFINRRTLAPIEFWPITLERRQNLKRVLCCLCRFHKNARLIYPWCLKLTNDTYYCPGDDHNGFSHR